MTSRELVEALLATGMSKSDIGKAVGRNSSTISQITREEKPKPARNLEAPLSALLANRRGAEVEVPAAPRRLAKSGQLANVRRSTAGGRTINVKAGSVRAGAKSIRNRLRGAAGDGQRVAWTVTYPPTVGVGYDSGTTSHHHGGGAGVVDFGNHGDGFSARVFADLVDEHDGNVGRAVSSWLESNGYIDRGGILPTAIELRTWDGGDDEDD